MADVLVIADDLTGANATSVLLSREGYKASTFLNLNQYDERIAKDFKVVSISTDSRGVAKNTAYESVYNTVEFFKDKGVRLFSKRIDSTLRGNIGAEIDAVLDQMKEHVAIVVSAFPSSERITIGGYLMVDSIPLENTDVAKDPKTPVYTSFVPTLIKNQSQYDVDYIPLSKVLKGVESLKDAICESVEKGHRIIVIDATTDEDITMIAHAVKGAKIKAIAVDPGPFTKELTKALIGTPNQIPGRKVMMSVGSVSNLTRKQIELLKIKHDCLFIPVDARALIYPKMCQDEINRVVDELIQKMDGYSILGIMTTTEENEVLNLSEIAHELNITEDDVSIRITNGLARITKKMIQSTDHSIGGLFTSGGDVTVAVCKELQTAGIEVKDEVLPLAVYGRLIKGKYHQMPIITKGGLIGENDAIVKCVEYLSTKISTDYHKNVSRKDDKYE